MRKKTAYDPRVDHLAAKVAELEARADAAEARAAAMWSEVKAMSNLFVGMLRNFTDFALENELERRAEFAVEPMGPGGEEAEVEP